jgi:hypothetical protein
VDGGRARTILSHFVVVVSRDSAEKKCNQTITGPTYGADYILEIVGQKWRALPNFIALRNRQNLVLGKNNQVSLTIGLILGTAAENTGWFITVSVQFFFSLPPEISMSGLKKNSLKYLVKIHHQRALVQYKTP